ncbi:hypothetical protein RB195_015312 [Necator americanus]
MSQSSGGGGTFTSVYHAFKEECNRYTQRKRIKIANKMTKMFNMSCNEANAEQLTAENFADLLPEFDTFIFGGDGLLWLRLGIITDVANLVNSLIYDRKRVFILTNDTTLSRESHEKKLLEHRFSRKLTKEHIITPGLLAANYITANGSPDDKGVYLIATGGIQDDIKEQGFSVFGQGPDAFASLKDDEGTMFNIDISVRAKNVCAVVVGLDKHFNFKKLMKATNFLKDPKCLFLATNDNATLSVPNGDIVIPDTGAIADAVKKASGREPLILGKPYSSGYDYIKKKWNIDESRTMVICSTINFDVMFGRNHGMRTLLILNNSHDLNQLEKMRNNHTYDILPHFYATSISAILPANNTNKHS